MIRSDDEQILKATKEGDLQLLQKLRDNAGGDEAFGRRCRLVRDLESLLTCLHIAAENGNLQICKFLIDEVKMDINIRADRGQTPMLLACLKGEFGTVQYFIIEGGDLNLTDYEGTTCLHAAAENGNIETIEYLLSKGAKIEAHSVHGTALQRAASCASVEAVRFLLSRDADANAQSLLSYSPLIQAILGRSHQSLTLLLEAGADPNGISRGLYPLAVAARETDTESLKLLLQAGANPNFVTMELLLPIEYAAKMGNVEGLNLLFEVTRRVSSYASWSILGIVDGFHSEIAMGKFKGNQDLLTFLYDETGNEYMSKKNYGRALEELSWAINLDPENARLRSNRSLCWLKLNEPNFALHDAEASIRLKPDWSEAHYRAGCAWVVLENYNKAWASFKKASELDPENVETEKALSLAVRRTSWWWCGGGERSGNQ